MDQLISDIEYYTQMADRETTQHSAIITKLYQFDDLTTEDKIELRELVMQYRVYNSLITATVVDYKSREKKTPRWMFWK